MTYNASDFVILSCDEAREEIKRRWQDEKLKKRVVDFLGGDIPEPFLRGPRGVLFRQLGIPDTETRRFVEICTILNIKPLITEYLNDKFTTRNPDKVRWGRIDVCERMNRNNEPVMRATRIIDFPANDNKRVMDVKTKWGESLVDFFHNAFEPMHQTKPEMVDMSDWFARNGMIASEYYKKFYALFVAHGILIDYYDDIDDLLKIPFFRDNEFANYCAVTKHFGVKPMVVQLFSREEVVRCDQWYFEAQMQGMLDHKLKGLHDIV